MISGRTKSGFTFEISDESLNDFELIDVAGSVDENPLLLPKLIQLLLGDEGKKALYDHVRNEKGKVPIVRIEEELKEIFAAHKELKNA